MGYRAGTNHGRCSNGDFQEYEKEFAPACCSAGGGHNTYCPQLKNGVQVDSARLKWTPNLHSHVCQVLRKYVVRVPPTLRCPDAAEWTDNWPRPSTFHETLSRDASRWRSPPSRHCGGRRIPT